jgi:hypothetical protein
LYISEGDFILDTSELNKQDDDVSPYY